MNGNSGTKKIDLDVSRLNYLILKVADAGDGISCDHANWANARLELYNINKEYSNLGETYLSDLTWYTTPQYDWKAVQIDQCNPGEKIMLDGFIYDKGLGVYANSEIIYRINNS